jgi:SAM-dependent methyltransferase
MVDPAPAARPAPDPTERFGNRAKAYARARPGYPPQAIDALAQALRLPAGAQIVDLGCGTGLSCEAFLRAGFGVVGVEPNEAMRLHAQRLASVWPRFAVVAGRAEATGLDEGQADLVVAAQAFHWFDVAATRAEALRILRRPALAALVWNDRRAEGSAFAEGYEALVRRFSPDYLEIRHRHERTDRVAGFFGHVDWATIRVEHADLLDYATLAQRMSSASYLPTPGQPDHAPMMAELQALFDGTAREGAVCMEFETRVLFGEIAAAAPGPTVSTDQSAGQS